MQNDFEHLVYLYTERKLALVDEYRETARANTRMEFHLDSLKIIFGPIFRNCCLLSCRCTRSAYADQTVKRFASFRDSERLSRPSVLSSSPSLLSILSESERYSETVVLRERFPKCTYELIYSILRLLFGNVRRDLPRECKGLRRYDYCKSHEDAM